MCKIYSKWSFLHLWHLAENREPLFFIMHIAVSSF